MADVIVIFFLQGFSLRMRTNRISSLFKIETTSACWPYLVTLSWRNKEIRLNFSAYGLFFQLLQVSQLYNRYRGVVNNTTSISNDVYIEDENIKTTCFGLTRPSSGLHPKVSEICKTTFGCKPNGGRIRPKHVVLYFHPLYKHHQKYLLCYWRHPYTYYSYTQRGWHISELVSCVW